MCPTHSDSKQIDVLEFEADSVSRTEKDYLQGPSKENQLLMCKIHRLSNGFGGRDL